MQLTFRLLLLWFPLLLYFQVSCEEAEMIFQCFKLSSLLNIESQRILRRVSSANFVHSVAGLLCRPTEEFNLSRAIDFLTQSKVRDVCVIQKKSLKDDDKCSVSAAADIIVIGSGVSQRHLNRIGEGILKEVNK